MATKNFWMEGVGLALWLAVLLIGVSGCGPKVIREGRILSVDEQLFDQAEGAYNARRFDEALHWYGDLLRRFPQSPVAPAALLKQGMIHGHMGAFNDAEAALGKVASAYPASPLAPVALVESLALSFQRGDYARVVEKGARLPDTLSPSDYRVRKYAILGDAHLALGQGADAVGAFMTAHDLARPAERKGMAMRLRKAIPSLTLSETDRLLSRVTDPEVRGDLLMGRMVALADMGRVGEARQGAAEFLALYVSHPVREEVAAFHDRLNRSSYNPKKLGCLLPFTGRYADYGRQAREGIELAFQEAAGSGAAGLELLFRDTGSDDALTQNAVQELVDEGAAAIIGPVGNVESAAAEAQRLGVPIVTMTGKEGVAASGDFVFRNFMTPGMQVHAVVSYAFEVLGLHAFAILYPDEPYGRDFMNLFWDEVARYGGEVRAVEAYEVETVDFSSVVMKLTGKMAGSTRVVRDQQGGERELTRRSKGPGQVDFEAIFIPDGAKGLELILPQLAFHDLGGVTTLGTNLWHNAALLKGASAHLGHSVIPEGFFAQSLEPRVQRFVSAFQGAYGRTPDYIEAVAYDSAAMLLGLLEAKRPATREEMRDELLAVNAYPGVTGATSFDETGDARKPLTLLTGERRRFVELPR